MAESIVVMGGSFNPPTVAHLRIMQTALDAVGARVGYFVPVSFAYLKRKMVRAGQGHLSLSDDLRVSMLEAMAATNGRLRVHTGAMGKPFSDDVALMRQIQEAHPGASLYSVFGADKLDLLELFARKSDFFERYGCVLFAREGAHLRDELASRELLACHREAFVLAALPEEVAGVSSTRVREHLFDVDAVVDMLHPDVATLLRSLRREDFPEEIVRFNGPHAFLSNEYPVRVTHEGVSYPCASSAFLASTLANQREKELVSRMGYDRAKQRFGVFPGAPGWEERHLATMGQIVREKFSQHPELAHRLAGTAGLKLVAGVRGKRGKAVDTFWHVDLYRWEGENHLGRILMRLREELREG